MEVVEHDRRRLRWSRPPGGRPPTCPWPPPRRVLAAAQPPPEGVQRVATAAVTDEHHRGGLQIEHHREVPPPLADGDLVDGDPSEPAELGSGEAVLEVAFLDVFDDVPADPEMRARRGSSSAATAPGRTAGRPWCSCARVGEVELDLPGHRETGQSTRGMANVMDTALGPMGTVRKRRSPCRAGERPATRRPATAGPCGAGGW